MNERTDNILLGIICGNLVAICGVLIYLSAIFLPTWGTIVISFVLLSSIAVFINIFFNSFRGVGDKNE